VTGRVGLIDLHALLLRAAGLDAPPGVPDLRDDARRGAAGERAHFAERNDRLQLGPDVPIYRSVRLGARCLIERFESDPPLRLAYDLAHDPLETRPLAEAPSELRVLLERHSVEQEALRLERLGEGEPAAVPALSEDESQRLRALGYGGARDR
jgi:hypothetical protein